MFFSSPLVLRWSRRNITERGKLTRQRKQYNEIHHQHGPKHRHIEDRKPRAHKTDRNGSCGRMPELELGQSADKRTKLFVLLDGQTTLAVLQAFVLCEGWVEFGLEEGEEEV